MTLAKTQEIERGPEMGARNLDFRISPGRDGLKPSEKLVDFGVVEQQVETQGRAVT